MSQLDTLTAVLDRPTIRSLVVETNDGIIATAGVVEGFAGAGATGVTLVIGAMSAMIAGGMALGGSRYAEEATERDARLAVIAEEQKQLLLTPDEEFAELVSIYVDKGLPNDLARQVAAELTYRDPLAAHIDAEHHLSLRDVRMGPLVIACAAGLAYALGSAIPLLSVLLAPDDWRAGVTFAATLVSLVVTSVFLARIGATHVRRAMARTLFIGVAAMSLSLLAGSLLHP